MIHHPEMIPFIRSTHIVLLEFKLQAIGDAENTSKRAATFKQKIDRKLLRTSVMPKGKLLSNELRYHKDLRYSLD